MDVAAIAVGHVLAAPPIVGAHLLQHRLAVGHAEVGAAVVGDLEVEVAGFGEHAAGGADDFAQQLYGESGLRRVKQV